MNIYGYIIQVTVTVKADEVSASKSVTGNENDRGIIDSCNSIRKLDHKQ